MAYKPQVNSVIITRIDINGLWQVAGIVKAERLDTESGDRYPLPDSTFSIPLTEEERALLKPLLEKIDARLTLMIGDLSE